MMLLFLLMKVLLYENLIKSFNIIFIILLSTLHCNSKLAQCFVLWTRCVSFHVAESHNIKGIGKFSSPGIDNILFRENDKFVLF